MKTDQSQQEQNQTERTPREPLYCRIINWFLTIELILLFVAFVGLVGVRALGIETYTVLTESMTPTYPAGTLLWVDTGISPTDAQIGDVIVYENTSEKEVAHRVVKNDDDGLIVKGDQNSEVDAPVEPDSFRGKVLFGIKDVGTIFKHLLDHRWLCVGVFIGANIILYTSSWLVKKRKLKTRER